MKAEIYLLFVVLAALTTGCVWSTSSAPEDAQVDFEGSINASDGEFSMEGRLVNFGQNAPRFENTSVYLYDQNRTLIGSVTVEPFTIRSPNFSISSYRLPEYIIIHSDEFWENNNVRVDYYIRADTEEVIYTVYHAKSEDELPIVPEADINITGSP